jgi:hypothetical protein
MVVLLLWPAWSIGDALTAPGTDTTAARLAEWARFNGLGWVVSGLEQVQYQTNPPKVGGSLAGGIPIVAPTHLKASPSHAPAPIPPQAHPSLHDEGIWQPLISVHGKPAIRAAFLRPDAQHTSYLVGVAWLDQKLVKLVLHPGFTVPGGSSWSQPFEVPVSQRTSLLATFNSGFTMMDANGGYRTAIALRRYAGARPRWCSTRMATSTWSTGRRPRLALTWLPSARTWACWWRTARSHPR